MEGGLSPQETVTWALRPRAQGVQAVLPPQRNWGTLATGKVLDRGLFALCAFTMGSGMKHLPRMEYPDCSELYQAPAPGLCPPVTLEGGIAEEKGSQPSAWGS